MPTIANMSKVNGIVISGSPAVPDAHVLIATATASSSATLSFTLGLDSLYDIYQFRFMNMHPATANQTFGFQVNAAGASGFNETITSTAFQAYHTADDGAQGFGYHAAIDQAQGTAYQILTTGVGNDNDLGASGILTLYAPSSTTYVKHFTARVQAASSVGSVEKYIGGYINVTTAIDEISFKFASGNIDAGIIKMFGVS